ncbi:peptidoglycan bridge formation glycyltransferase FemA/FemB family protein [Candidatus Saccharibacteria bacterium]|nr:peptidoglycan bridge formation glycyltransferase FemA/FemB family protein [Candidatus Saccharibacteria bacterium]
MEIPITQTKEWKKLQDDLNEISFFETGNDYQFLAILKKTPVGNYLYLPYGPIAKTETGFKSALNALKILAKKENAIFIRIEPQNPETKQFFPKNTKKTKDLNPKETWILDLTPSVDEIYQNMKQNTRNLSKNYSKKGLKVIKTTAPEKIDHLVKLQHKLAKERHIGVFSKDYLKAELEQPFASLYLVEYPADSGQIIAASLFFDYQDTRYYMQSASDSDYKKLPATIALLNEAIFDAKEKGIKYFDFWGIAPENAPKNHPWAGFTSFKKSFGGEPKTYAGTYDLILKPAKYKLYEATRKLNRLLRKN